MTVNKSVDLRTCQLTSLMMRATRVVTQFFSDFDSTCDLDIMICDFTSEAHDLGDLVFKRSYSC